MADVSRHYYQWSLPDGNIKFKTIAGATITICLTLVVLAYALSQFIVFWERTSYTVLNSTTENVFTEDNLRMERKDSFVVAAAFVPDSKLFPDEDIGELKFILKTWGTASGDLEFKELKHRKCQDADFVNPRGGQTEYGFFEMDETTKGVV